MICEAFTFTGSRRFCVRRTAVYEAVSRALGCEINVPTCLLISDVCRDLGASTIVVFNRRLYSRMHPAGMAELAALEHAKDCRRDPRGRRLHMLRSVPPPDPRLRPGTKAYDRLRRDWYARLTAEGFRDAELSNGELVRTSYHASDPVRASINTAHFDDAADRFWRLEQDRQILQLHAIDGLSVRAIAARLSLGRDLVHRTLLRLLAGHRGEGEETSHGQEADDDRGDTEDA